MDALLKQFLDAGAVTVAGNVILRNIKLASWTQDSVTPTPDGLLWLENQNAEPQQVIPPPMRNMKAPKGMKPMPADIVDALVKNLQE